MRVYSLLNKKKIFTAVFLYSLLILSSFPLKAQDIDARIDSLQQLMDASDEQKKGELFPKLIRIYIDIGDYEFARVNIREFYTLSEKIGQLKGIGACFHLSALIYQRQAAYENAKVNYLKALEYRKAARDSIGISGTLNNLGNTCYEQGLYDQSLNYHLQALAIRQLIKDSIGLSSSYNNIANVYQAKEGNKKALEYYFLSLRMATALKHKSLIGNGHINIANVYIDLDNLDLALNYLEKALKIVEDENNQIDIIICYTLFSNVYKKLNNPQKRLEYIDKALTLALKVKDHYGIIGVYNELADYYKGMQQYNKAIQSYQLALKSSMVGNNTLEQGESYLGIGDTYIKLGQEDKALSNLNLAMNNFVKIKSIKMIQQVHGKLMEAYRAKKDFKNAYEHYVQQFNIKDSLLNVENLRHINELSASYEDEKKQKEIQLLKKTESVHQLAISNQQSQINKQKLIGFFSFLAIALIAILLYLVYKRDKLKKRANEKLTNAYAELETKNTEVTDSIHYSKRLQKAVLMKEEEIRLFLPSFFIFYQPKDIVSGDFYWFAKVKQQIVIAVADCTGHGVPGALMAMLGNSLLNQAVNEQGITDPGEILCTINKNLFKTFSQNNELDAHADGLDISICVIDTQNKELQYSAANHSLYVIKRNNTEILNGEPYSIGGVFGNLQASFATKKLSLEPGTHLYLTTDGILDQFGEKNKQKFMQRRFVELLQKLSSLDMDQQKQGLVDEFMAWKGKENQTDDVLVWGINPEKFLSKI